MIAVVEDDDSVRNAVVRLLQASGHPAPSFASGQQLVDAQVLRNAVGTWDLARNTRRSLPGGANGLNVLPSATGTPTYNRRPADFDLDALRDPSMNSNDSY